MQKSIWWRCSKYFVLGTLLFSATVLAGDIRDATQHVVALVDSQLIVRLPNQNIAFRFSDANLYDQQNRLIMSVTTDGTVRYQDGSIAGHIKQGDVKTTATDSYNRLLGTIDSHGTAYRDNGSIVGSSDDVSAQILALWFFFLNH